MTVTRTPHHPHHPQVVLTLEALPVDGVPLAVRVRSVLKRLLRDYRFRCLRIDGDALEDASAEHQHAQDGRGTAEEADGPS